MDKEELADTLEEYARRLRCDDEKLTNAVVKTHRPSVPLGVINGWMQFEPSRLTTHRIVFTLAESNILERETCR